MKVVNNLEELYSLASTSPFDPSDPNYTTISTGDIVYVRGYLNDEDGGGGFFIFETTSDLEPFYQDVQPASGDYPYQSFEEMLKIGYSPNYDGMVCKSAVSTLGIWKRQWDRGKLNLRWFGARPEGMDISPAINAALKYAQFDIPIRERDENGNLIEPAQYEPELTTFNNRAYTRPGKTIFIPSGRYYVRSFIDSIRYGVVFEGEGNMGTSSHGTRLLIAHGYNDFAYLDPNDPTSSILPVGNEKGAFFRFYADGSNNSGGGLKDLSISVPEITNADGSTINAFDSNIISLISTQTSCTDANGNTIDCPSVSKWKAENLVFTMYSRAKRAIIMESNQNEYGLYWRIRDPSIINCWFAGASMPGQTVRITKTSGLHVIGGFFSSGLGTIIDETTNQVLTIKPGIFLNNCANIHLNGVDLTHGEIFIYKKSRFVNIDCRFGKLSIYNGADKEHIDLQVSKKYVLNPRTETPDYLLCPFHSDNNNTSNPNGYKCYNNAHEIEEETDADWLHVSPQPIT